MKTILSITFLLLATVLYSQKSDAPDDTGLTGAVTQFKNDLESSNLKIYTLGGFYQGDYETDVAFQKEYNLKYDSFGCTAPPNLSYYEAYNLLVFKHLEENYGIVWEEKIREDALALQKWKELE